MSSPIICLFVALNFKDCCQPQVLKLGQCNLAGLRAIVDIPLLKCLHLVHSLGSVDVASSEGPLARLLSSLTKLEDLQLTWCLSLDLHDMTPVDDKETTVRMLPKNIPLPSHLTRLALGELTSQSCRALQTSIPLCPSMITLCVVHGFCWRVVRVHKALPIWLMNATCASPMLE